ncbi:hypothetical protein GGR57DRAFT_494308 [Xylariaceae sp. FL1272]|nr:hypothetical protein GGR57DRAFT_494308 [Xylariaceae sp. FL1272]
MFSIDPSLLPSFRTRKALLVIDAQNDFLSEHGALPVKTPFDLPDRIAKLVDGFRQGGGEIIWVRTEFESPRPAEDERISTPGRSPASAEPPRGRRPRNSPSTTETTTAPEAFLTLEPGAHPRCVIQGTEGAELHPVVKRSMGPRDQVIVKSFYSAFRSMQLLQLLRVKFVTELFICGSDIGVCVMATAMDAASHGYNITVVHDCCGAHSMTHHRVAMRHISNTTGCNKLSADQVLESMNAGQPRSSVPPSVGHLRDPEDDIASSSVSDIELSLEKLSLSDGTAALKSKRQTLPNQEDCCAQTEDQANRDTVVSPSSSKSSLDSFDTPPTLIQPLVKDIFEKIQNEVDWKRMSHQGGEVPRLVAVQGLIDEDGNMPVYRHPADESPPLLPFTPIVDQIRRVIEMKLGHSLNHVLIQLYRHGNDYISEHSDKTLDIAKGSFIANRQPKKQDAPGQESEADSLKRQVQKARLPHNSLCQMGLRTNMRWLHAIRQDKRLARDKSSAELAYDGARISLTFRHIGTFLDRENKHIWGQGATAKTKEDAREIINGQTPEAIEMLRAFGRENQSSDFDWEAHYGAGFDVLHISAAPRLFLSSDSVVNLRVQMMLAEFGISYARGSITASSDQQGSVGASSFIDTDERKTTVEGQRDIMTYLNKTYGQFGPSIPDDDSYEALEGLIKTMDEWQSSQSAESARLLEARMRDDVPFVHGDSLGLRDFVLWPWLHVMMPTLSVADKSGLPKLMAYYERVCTREAISKMLGALAQPVARHSVVAS